MDNQEMNLGAEVETEIAVEPTPVLTAEEEHQAMLNDFTQFIRDTHPKLKDVADEAFIVTIYPHHTLAVATVDIKVRAEGIEENFAFTIPNEDLPEVRFAMATQAYGILKQISSEHPNKIGNYRLKFNPQTIYFDREKAGEGFEEFAELYLDEFDKIEKKVDRVGKAIVDMIRNRAGYALKNFVTSLPEKQQYDLIFTWNFDEKNHLSYCLDKIAPVHDDPETASVNRTPVNLDEWLDENGEHNKSLVYLCNQMKNINTMIDQSLNFNSGSKVKDDFTKQLFDKVIFHPLYNDNKTILAYNDAEGKDIVEQTDAILSKLQELAGPDGDVRLDLDSLQVYRWDAEGNSSLVLPVDVIQQFFAKYIQSFGNTLYHHLKTLSSPLIRPHVVRTQVEPTAEGAEAGESKGAAVADLLAQSGVTKKASNGQPQIDQVKMYLRQAVQMGIYEQANEAAAKAASEEYRRQNPIKAVTDDPYLYRGTGITAEQARANVTAFKADGNVEPVKESYVEDIVKLADSLAENEGGEQLGRGVNADTGTIDEGVSQYDKHIDDNSLPKFPLTESELDRASKEALPKAVAEMAEMINQQVDGQAVPVSDEMKADLIGQVAESFKAMGFDPATTPSAEISAALENICKGMGVEFDKAMVESIVTEMLDADAAGDENFALPGEVTGVATPKE